MEKPFNLSGKLIILLGFLLILSCLVSAGIIEIDNVSDCTNTDNNWHYTVCINGLSDSGCDTGNGDEGVCTDVERQCYYDNNLYDSNSKFEANGHIFTCGENGTRPILSGEKPDYKNLVYDSPIYDGDSGPARCAMVTEPERCPVTDNPDENCYETEYYSSSREGQTRCCGDDNDDLDNEDCLFYNKDSDKDNVLDKDDVCPFIHNPNQYDNDKDGKGDICDNDDDNDGLWDANDNCPMLYNPNQENSDNNGMGDACEVPYDGDGDNDGILDVDDNCVLVYNPNQEDKDNDGIGDACDDIDDSDTDDDEDDEESSGSSSKKKEDDNKWYSYYFEDEEDGMKDIKHDEIKIVTYEDDKDKSDFGLGFIFFSLIFLIIFLLLISKDKFI